MLSQYLNPIYSTLHTFGNFEQELIKCLQNLTESKSVEDPNFVAAAGDRDKDIWVPLSWVDLFQPVAHYFVQIVQRFRDTQQSSDTGNLVRMVKGMCDAWIAHDPILQHQKAVLQPLDLALRSLDFMAEKRLQAETKAFKSGRAALSGFADLAPNTAMFQFDAVAGAIESAPRHDNDFVDICKISIVPTRDEALSSRPPFLPKNADEAQHHLAGMERLLDIQFRLLREDFTR